MFMTALFLSSCGLKEKEPEQMEMVEEAEQPEMTEEEPDKTELEKAEPEEEKQEEEILEGILEEEEEELPDWALAYRDFLTERENLIPILLEEGEGGLRGFLTGFYLHDLNGDDIPELFLQKDYAADYVYTYTGTQMELRNVIEEDCFADAYFGYDLRDGQAYYFIVDSGTGTDRSIGLCSIFLSEKVHDMGETVVAWTVREDDGLNGLYGALYGGIEKADGTYDNVEWEDAIPSEYNDITPEEFQAVVVNFCPFDFHEITEENIETYITADYRSVITPCSLRSYQEKIEERREAFQNEEYFYEMKDGEFLVPDGVFMTSDWIGDIYCDLNHLVCYSEDDLAPKIGEEKMPDEWKEIYREWAENIDQETDFYGDPVLADQGEASVAFYDWEGMDAPVLWVDSGWGASKYHFFTVIDGNIVNIGTHGKAPNGFVWMELINDTMYCFKHIATPIGVPLYIFQGTLYRVNQGEMEEVWSCEWQEILGENFWEEEIPEPEYSKEEPFCTLFGEEKTKDECMAEVDALLGDGAAAQLLDIIRYDSTEETVGPLTFAETDNVWYTWDQFLKNLSF